VARAQILLDRARFSPGEIDGVYGDDFGIAVKGYQENHGLKPTGTIDAEMWRLVDSEICRRMRPEPSTATASPAPGAQQSSRTWLR
jgi:peptidoglycan hydrolase-like protein with peptidoglycan-binding domain